MDVLIVAILLWILLGIAFVAKVEGIEMYLLNKKSRRRLKSVACLL